jgi:hypothetical protein
MLTGDTRYIYHGNDGTSFPWNDTAQLDYTRAQVREAVIQTILHVARNFPVIRFDAAMTLAKKHVQRLWFPAPGEGGAIPSRAEHGMSKAEFDALMPNEFWREVVDRVAAEVPDTLLLAEASYSQSIADPVQVVRTDENPRQGDPVGRLSGYVTDPDGAVIPFALVSITNKDTSEYKTATASAEGLYEFNELTPGSYVIKFEAGGFDAKEMSNVYVSEAASLRRDAQLDLPQVAE